MSQPAGAVNEDGQEYIDYTGDVGGTAADVAAWLTARGCRVVAVSEVGGGTTYLWSPPDDNVARVLPPVGRTLTWSEDNRMIYVS